MKEVRPEELADKQEEAPRNNRIWFPSENELLSAKCHLPFSDSLSQPHPSHDSLRHISLPLANIFPRHSIVAKVNFDRRHNSDVARTPHTTLLTICRP